MESALSKWQKGGLRYAKLQRIVPEFLAPEEVLAFFVGVRGRGGEGRLFNPFTPLQREYVVAVTGNDLVVLGLRLPGVFRASIGGVAYRVERAEVDLKWADGRLTVGGVTYSPISFHGPDAERLAQLLQ